MKAKRDGGLAVVLVPLARRYTVSLIQTDGRVLHRHARPSATPPAQFGAVTAARPSSFFRPDLARLARGLKGLAGCAMGSSGTAEEGGTGADSSEGGRVYDQPVRGGEGMDREMRPGVWPGWRDVQAQRVLWDCRGGRARRIEVAPSWPRPVSSVLSTDSQPSYTPFRTLLTRTALLYPFRKNTMSDSETQVRLPPCHLLASCPSRFSY